MAQDMDRPGRTASAGADPGCSCAEARAHLEAFLDQECTADLTERLARHVDTCPHCSQVADAERHLRKILRSRCAEQAPAALRERVRWSLSVMRSESVTVSAVRTTGTGGVVGTTVTAVESITYRHP
jgi:mycothiol system anti-sigma-R factor